MVIGRIDGIDFQIDTQVRKAYTEYDNVLDQMPVEFATRTKGVLEHIRLGMSIYLHQHDLNGLKRPTGTGSGTDSPSWLIPKPPTVPGEAWASDAHACYALLGYCQVHDLLYFGDGIGVQ
jgi:hypothetical protein